MAKKKAAQNPDPDAEAAQETVAKKKAAQNPDFDAEAEPVLSSSAPCCPSESHDHLSLSWYVRTDLAFGLRSFGAQERGSKSRHRFAPDCEIFRVFNVF